MLEVAGPKIWTFCSLSSSFSNLRLGYKTPSIFSRGPNNIIRWKDDVLESGIGDVELIPRLTYVACNLAPTRVAKTATRREEHAPAVLHPRLRAPLPHNYEPGDHLFVVHQLVNHEVLHARYCRHGLRRRPGLCPRGQPLGPCPCHAGTSPRPRAPFADSSSDGLIDCSLRRRGSCDIDRMVTGYYELCLLICDLVV